MRLIQFHRGNKEYFINPDKIIHVYKHDDEDSRTVIELDEDLSIIVDETIRTTIARINNDELNVAYDCMGEIERLKQKVKNLQSNTQPSEV